MSQGFKFDFLDHEKTPERDEKVVKEVVFLVLTFLLCSPGKKTLWGFHKTSIFNSHAHTHIHTQHPHPHVDCCPK